MKHVAAYVGSPNQLPGPRFSDYRTALSEPPPGQWPVRKRLGQGSDGEWPAAETTAKYQRKNKGQWEDITVNHGQFVSTNYYTVCVQ